MPSTRLYNLVEMTVSGTPGTGTITLASATANNRFSFAEAGVPNGAKVSYVVRDGTDIEYGEGTYTSSGTTLSRDVVRASKIGGTAGTGKINLTSSAVVYIDAAAQDFDVNDFTEDTSPDFTADFLWIHDASATLKKKLKLNNATKKWTLTVITATNASWPVPSGTTELVTEAWSGGGSGGGQSGGTQRGGGGASGSYGYKHYKGTIDSTLNVTIGAGGASASSTNGNAGGTTSVVGTNLGTLSLNGGGGGFAGSNLGGAGSATASGWDFFMAGSDGHNSYPGGNYFGAGGDAPRGGRGAKNNVAQTGNAPGGGGSGENHVGGGSGAGARGQVHIWTR